MLESGAIRVDFAAGQFEDVGEVRLMGRPLQEKNAQRLGGSRSSSS
jgi:hypothetical protein